MAFSPGMGREGGHGAAVYFGLIMSIFKGPMADAGRDEVVVERKVDAVASVDTWEKNVRREEEGVLVLVVDVCG